MSFEPNPQQAFLIFSMIFGRSASEREPSFSAAPIDKAPRDELEREGFIKFERRGRTGHVLLEDKAWAWAAENLSAKLPPGRPKKKPAAQPSGKSKKKRETKPNASDLLRAVLSHLHDYLRKSDHALADLVSRGSSDDLEHRVRGACLDLAHGAVKERVRLKDLRAKLPTARDELDAALLRMQTEGKLVLYRMDNPAELTPEDEVAALYIAGNPRHLVYLET